MKEAGNYQFVTFFMKESQVSSDQGGEMGYSGTWRIQDRLFIII